MLQSNRPGFTFVFCHNQGHYTVSNVTPSPTLHRFSHHTHTASYVLQQMATFLRACEAMLAGMTVTANQAHAAAYAPVRHLCGAITKSGAPCRRTGRCPFHAAYMEPI